MCKKPNIVVNNSTLKEGFKKKVTNLGHCPIRGGGGLTPKIECPNLLKCFDTKI